MVGRYAVRQSVRTSRVLRHVSANRAGALAGGVRRIEIPDGLHGKRNIQIHNTGLDHRALICQIDFKDAVHSRKRNNHTASAGNRSSAQARSCPPAHNRKIVSRSELHQCDDILGGSGKHDHLGQRLVYAAVVLVKV